jgi:SpoVK/Ycf46/Vps4 family AAA+-type ATPase
MQEHAQPVFVGMTANNIVRFAEQFPELLRKGRFDETFFVDLPTPEERVEIVTVQIARKARDPQDFSLATLVSVTEGFSGAEIEAVVDGGLLTAFEAGRDLTTADLVAAAKDLTPLALLAKDSIDALRTWAKGRCRYAAGIAPKADTTKRKLKL